MVAELIRLLFAAACGLFVLSLPLLNTRAGTALRRAALVCFILALLPSFLCGVLYTSAVSDDAGGTAPGAATGMSRVRMIATMAVLSLLAHAILRLRARLRAKAKVRDPWETFFSRGGGKKRPQTRTAAEPPPFFHVPADEDEP